MLGDTCSMLNSKATVSFAILKLKKPFSTNFGLVFQPKGFRIGPLLSWTIFVLDGHTRVLGQPSIDNKWSLLIRFLIGSRNSARFGLCSAERVYERFGCNGMIRSSPIPLGLMNVLSTTFGRQCSSMANWFGSTFVSVLRCFLWRNLSYTKVLIGLGWHVESSSEGVVIGSSRGSYLLIEVWSFILLILFRCSSFFLGFFLGKGCIFSFLQKKFQLKF